MPFRPPPASMNVSSHSSGGGPRPPASLNMSSHSSGGGPRPASAAQHGMKPELTAADEEVAEQYRKMLKMGMPEGAVTHKMAMYGVAQHIIDAVIPPEEPEPPETETTTEGSSPAGLTDEEEDIAWKYRRMLTMGMPEGAVAQKMSVDEVPKNIQNAVLDPVSTAEDDPFSTFDEEEIVSKYRKILQMGMPEGAVAQKMAVDEVPQHIQDAVLADEESSAPAPEIQPTPLVDETEEEPGMIPTIIPLDNKNPSPNAEESNEVEIDNEEEEAVGKEREQTVELDATPLVVNEILAQETTTSTNESRPDKYNLAEYFEKSGETTYEFYSSDDSFEEEEIVFEEEEIVDDEELVDEEDLQESTNDIQGQNVVKVSEEVEHEEEVLHTLQSEQDKTNLERGAVHDTAENSTIEIFEDEGETETIDFTMVQKDDYSVLSDEDEEMGIWDALDQDREMKQAPGATRSAGFYPDRTFHRLVFLVYLLMVGGGVAVSLVFLLDDDETPQGTPTSSMDDVNLDSCDFSDSAMPNVIDQCRCDGEITIIPIDVRYRYQLHLEDFIARLYQEYDDPISSCTVRNQALVWLSTANDYEFSDAARRERYALANLFIGTKGETWTQSDKWLSESYVCSWFGVTCKDGKVKEITLTANNLAGSILEEIVILQQLSKFSVSENVIGGEIPRGIFFIPALTNLDWSKNQLRGGIPSTIQEARRLRDINLESNNLRGTIPDEIDRATSIVSLNLASNSFQGSIPISIFDLPKLTNLQLQSNQLEGSFPEHISRISSLKVLNLSSNFFVGSLPSSLGDIATLEKLILQDLALGGSLPDIFGKLTNMLELMISETDIDGTLPRSLEKMTNIQVLELDFNQLRGKIPSSLGGLTTLSLLNLGGNSFSGSIPTQLGSLSNLLTLLINDNALIGDVPDDLGRLENLEIMTLDGNIIQGAVPKRVCDLRREGNLEELIVDCAAIECEIPECCTSCRE